MLSKENTGGQMAGNQGTLLPNSQQILKLPEGFEVKEAIGGGDCFFDSVAQGLKQLKPDMEFTIKSLRQICKNLALSDQQLKKQIVADAKSFHDPTIIPSCHTINDDALWNAYLAGIEYTAEDMKGMETQEPHLYKALTNSKYGSTLQVPMWGRPNIEGKMICSKYNVKLHIIENLPNSGYSHQLINELTSRSIDCVDYDEENTIHIINKGASHFEPILRKQTLSHGHNIMISSEENPDSKSVHLQQNSQNDAADDYQPDVEVLPAESTVVDYEDRLSGDISDGTWHSALDDAASDEVMKKATFFVKTFVKEFEEKIFEYSEEAKPGSKTRKVGRIVGQFKSIVNNLIPPNPLRLSCTEAVECVDYVSAKRHREKAKSVSIGVVSFKDNRRESLIEAGLEIFQKFEEQFIKIVDANSSWQRGIEKLAVDAVYRIMDYSSNVSKGKDLFVDFITKGVVFGNSKKRRLSLGDSGHKIKDEQSSKTSMTSDLYMRAGIKKIENKIVHYYQYGLLERYEYAEKCSYRLPFVWELEEWEEVKQQYVPGETPIERYVRILDDKKKEKLACFILKEINENDPIKKRDIEDLRKEIKDLRIHHEKEDKNTFSFNLDYLPKFFIKRKVMLDELKKKLDSKNQEVEMSRQVLINGEYGTGKSELARSYGYNKEEGNNVWTNVTWIDARTYGTLLNSFRSLAGELKILTKNGQEINTDMEVKERQEGGIKYIVKDVYKHFRDVKSLFIFDNASNYEEIEQFLPSHFSDLFFGKEKPYVLITSRSKNWKKEIERIDLDDGFFPEEAIAFIRKILEIEDRSQDCCLIELAQTLNYLPLALAQATAYIKQEEINISEYLTLYKEAIQKPSPDHLEALGLTKELFTTLTLNLVKIKEEKNIGQQSHNFLTYMAYLSPDQIDTAEIFLRKKSEKDKQQVLDIFDLLNKFSVIELEESTAKVHKGIQKTIRVEEELAGTEEETLRGIMTSFCLTNVNHITSVWSHVSKYSKLVNEFIDSLYDGGTILHLLAKDGNEEVIRLILEKIDPNKLSKVINSINEEGFTSLSCAIIYGHLGIVQYLVGKGSDVNLKNKKGMGPLHFAVICGHLDVVKHLVMQGAIVELCNKDNMEPLHFAATYGHLDIVKYLVIQGAIVEPRNKDNMEPLHFAAIYGHLDIVKYLVEEGANANLQSKEGESPLHFAAMHGHLGIVEYFIEKMVNMNLKDIDNNTILDYAVMSDYPDIIECLLEWGANVSPECEDSLYSYAITNNHQSIICYLAKAQSIVSPLKRKSETISHMQSQVLMEEKPMTSDLQSNILSDSGQYQYELSKKRRLENMSATSEKNTSMPSVDLFNRMEMESVVNFINMPMHLFSSVTIEPVNNKSLQVG